MFPGWKKNTSDMIGWKSCWGKKRKEKHGGITIFESVILRDQINCSSFIPSFFKISIYGSKYSRMNQVKFVEDSL